MAITMTELAAKQIKRVFTEHKMPEFYFLEKIPYYFAISNTKPKWGLGSVIQKLKSKDSTPKGHVLILVWILARHAIC